MSETIFDNPADFWQAITPGPGTASRIYRGQFSSNWKLEPWIFRQTFAHHLDPRDSSRTQVQQELGMLLRFVKCCDRIGLPIPGDGMELRSQFLNTHHWRPRVGYSFPPESLYALLALAQHHRLPTRLLDWTRRSFVAAYFAASAAARSDDKSGFLSVWSLETRPSPFALTDKLFTDDTLRNKHPKVRIIEMPGSNNRNLVAQAGLFTMLLQDMTGPRVPPEGPVCLDDYFDMADDHQKPLLKQLSISHRFAGEIIELCRLHWVTQEMLFPDYYGAAAATLFDLSFGR